MTLLAEWNEVDVLIVLVYINIHKLTYVNLVNSYCIIHLVIWIAKQLNFNLKTH